MTFFQSLLFGLVQALTEFLPVSSSGHLALVAYFLNLEPSLSFDIFLNTATLFSVLFFFRHDIKDFMAKFPYIIVGSLPAGLVGFFFKDYFERLFTDITLLPIFFLITSVMLFLTRYLKKQAQPLTYTRALVIGLFQAFAIIPSVSRSASTIFASLAMGLSPADAFKFSFFLFIPASFGALLLDIKDTGLSSYLNPVYLATFVVTFAVGLVALKILRRVLVSKHLWLFAPYVFLLSLVLYLSRF